MKLAIRLLGALLLAPGLSFANTVGVGAQNFNTTTSGLDFVTVQSSETLKPGIFNIGLFVNHAVNSLPYYDRGSAGRTQYNDSLLGADVNFGVGLGPNWDMGLSFPSILSQDVKVENVPHGEFEQTGSTEIRANTKYRFWGNDSHGLAVIGSVGINRVENDPFSGQEPGPTYNLELAADTTFHKKVAAAVNLGHRWRHPGAPIPGSFLKPLGNQYIYSTAVSYLVHRLDTKVIGEIFGSVPAQSTDRNTDRSNSSAEWLVGVKHDINSKLALHAGGGTELMHGLSSPDWRVYAGLNYTFGPVFKKQDAMTTPVGARFTISDIIFDFDSAQMAGDYEAVLDRVGRHLQKGFQRVTITGHTDSIGPAAYNLKLSQARAQAIRDYLVRVYRLDGTRIQAFGKGEAEPIADNGNFQGRQTNRRVEFTIQ